MKFALLLFVVVAVPLAAQDHETKFSAVKIETAKVARLSDATKALDTAVSALVLAQAAVDVAQNNRQSIMDDIKREVFPFES